jgi:histidinol dehydrogenase
VALRLDSSHPQFAHQFETFLDSKREASKDVSKTVAALLDKVRSWGDEAVIDQTKHFDKLSLTPGTLRFSDEEVEAASARISGELRAALQVAHDRIYAHHEKQKPLDHVYQDALGVTLGALWKPIDAVGIYVPGGLAAYPSSVLMNAVPAKVAGVGRIAMTVPTPGGEANDAVLAAAKIAGVSEIYRIGGAQAIGALAYGTKTIPPVNKIVGPGNAYVAEAKRQVFGTVGIDMIAGPSEVLIIADKSANPSWIAADLLAQAEHGAGAQSILITDDAAIADSAFVEVSRQVALLPREKITREGWEDYGAIIVVKSLAEAIELANRIASEHVELMVDDPQPLLGKLRNAGAVFLGHHTPEAIGDYVGGTNHVLPTARSAKFASGLGVLDFMKRTSVLGCDPSSLAALRGAAVTLATAEGLDAHGRSITIRLNR